MDLSDLLDQAENGYQIPCQKENGDIDLFAKSYSGDTLLHVAVVRKCLKEIRFLVEEGLDIDARGDFWETPLYVAVSTGDIALIAILLKLGADPKIPNHLGVLPGDLFFEQMKKWTDVFVEDLHILCEKLNSRVNQ